MFSVLCSRSPPPSPTYFCLSTYLSLWVFVSLSLSRSLYCSAFPLLSVSFLSLFSFNLYLSLSLLLKVFLLRELSSDGLPEICDTQFDFLVTWSVAIDFYSSHFGLNISAGFCSVLCFPDLPMYVQVLWDKYKKHFCAQYLRSQYLIYHLQSSLTRW